MLPAKQSKYQHASPPCNCRLKNDNANGLSFPKGKARLEPVKDNQGMPARPPQENTVSLGISRPNFLLQTAPKWSLSWRSQSSRPDPKRLRTPRKSPDRKGYA